MTAWSDLGTGLERYSSTFLSSRVMLFESLGSVRKPRVTRISSTWLALFSRNCVRAIASSVLHEAGSAAAATLQIQSHTVHASKQIFSIKDTSPGSSSLACDDAVVLHGDASDIHQGGRRSDEAQSCPSHLMS